MMSGIRGKNTKPEIFLRKGLHAEGFRFRIHAPLPGKPDMVFAKWNAVLFVHGCFWHGHNCHLFKWPKTRDAFWQVKIHGNAVRDDKNLKQLRHMGWRVGIVWECAQKGRTRLDSDQVLKTCSRWLKSNKRFLEIQGTDDAPRPSLRPLRRNCR